MWRIQSFSSRQSLHVPLPLYASPCWLHGATIALLSLFCYSGENPVHFPKTVQAALSTCTSTTAYLSLLAPWCYYSAIIAILLFWRKSEESSPLPYIKDSLTLSCSLHVPCTTTARMSLLAPWSLLLYNFLTRTSFQTLQLSRENIFPNTTTF